MLLLHRLKITFHRFHTLDIIFKFNTDKYLNFIIKKIKVLIHIFSFSSEVGYNYKQIMYISNFQIKFNLNTKINMGTIKNTLHSCVHL